MTALKTVLTKWQLLLDMTRKYELANLRNSYWTSNYIIWMQSYPNSVWAKINHILIKQKVRTALVTVIHILHISPWHLSIDCTLQRRNFFALLIRLIQRLNYTMTDGNIFLRSIWKLLIKLRLEKNAKVYMIKSIMSQNIIKDLKDAADFHFSSKMRQTRVHLWQSDKVT